MGRNIVAFKGARERVTPFLPHALPFTHSYTAGHTHTHTHADMSRRTPSRNTYVDESGVGQ